MRIMENAGQLDRAFQALADYIAHNEWLDSSRSVRATLRVNGYEEPVQQTTLFRALFHQITDQDRARHHTVGELFETLRREVRMDMNRSQGFSTSLERVMKVFVNGTLHISHYAEDWPVHHPEAPLADLKSIIVVYEVECNPEQIVFSMKGLKAFLKHVGNTGEGFESLLGALGDPEPFGSGYGSDDEVFVDTRKGCHIADMHLYDVREHYPHDDERDWG